jgi:hypothetical protein
MNTKTDMEPKLQIIPGTYPLEISFGTLRIVAAPKDRPPFKVGAVAFEEDTFLVMSAEPIVRAPKESLMRVMTRVIETQPETPGTVLVRGKRPLRLLAVVHDLNQEPSWREEWVADCLEKILAEAKSRKLKSIALPFLGTLHGRLERGRFLELLGHALSQTELRHLECIWLVVPDGMNSKILEILESGTHG